MREKVSSHKDFGILHNKICEALEVEADFDKKVELRRKKYTIEACQKAFSLANIDIDDGIEVNNYCEKKYVVYYRPENLYGSKFDANNWEQSGCRCVVNYGKDGMCRRSAYVYSDDGTEGEMLTWAERSIIRAATEHWWEFHLLKEHEVGYKCFAMLNHQCRSLGWRITDQGEWIAWYDKSCTTSVLYHAIWGDGCGYTKQMIERGRLYQDPEVLEQAIEETRARLNQKAVETRRSVLKQLRDKAK